ncbi:MAG: hypothetical protein P8184_03830 [Calditrichia bacterium]
MFGKGSVLVILGFILAFATYERKMNRAVMSSSDNFNTYYSKAVVHESAISSINYAINQLWSSADTSDNFTMVANGCTTNVSIFPLNLDTIQVKAKSRGYVFEDEYWANHNSLMLVQDSVMANFSYKMSLSKYFWFTNNENGVYWIGGDTVWGPIHTNTVLNTNGDPVFYGKVTAFKGIAPNPARKSGADKNLAKFYGGWEVGIKNDIPTDLSYLINAANAANGTAAPNTKCIYDKETSFEFLANGDVIRTVDGSAPDTVAITDIAPTGVIYSSMDVRVKGVFNGQLTIYSNQNLWIDDDIVYADDPNTNPNSNDLLGLVAKQNVVISENGMNNNDVTIQSCIMAMDGSFTAENFSTRPISGKIDFTGSIVQNKRGGVGTFSSWSGSITHGFNKYYRYDKRLEYMAPPYYPFLRSLRLVSWWE